MTLVMSTQSTEYVRVPVRPLAPDVDPTSDTVSVAFLTGSDGPTDDDWVTGSWEPGSVAPYYARVLVGPGTGGHELAAGVYRVWLKFSDDPEVPVRRAGFVSIE